MDVQPKRPMFRGFKARKSAYDFRRAEQLEPWQLKLANMMAIVEQQDELNMDVDI